MTLYHSQSSPYVRKVMVLAHEAGLARDITLVENASGSPLDPGRIPVAANPLGKIPVLVRSDGSALYDSRVICQYLDARAQSGFYPDGRRKWDALVLEATADGILDAALLMVYEHRLRPEALQFPAYVEGQWSKIARSLDLIEDRWMAYLAGPLCIGQIALACALGYLDLRHDARGWQQDRPALAAWQVRIAARDSLRATAPPDT
ncbi:MAG: glutathione S-transferase [Rhodobacteraceae bacterium]|nr:MAG: glutathione S-transferase [Paracoccaceae bacterium]